jgi:hypothetical protein
MRTKHVKWSGFCSTAQGKNLEEQSNSSEKRLELRTKQLKWLGFGAAQPRSEKFWNCEKKLTLTGCAAAQRKFWNTNKAILDLVIKTTQMGSETTF